MSREKPPLLPGARFVSCPAVSYQRREAGSGLSHAIISLERCTSGSGLVTLAAPIETVEYLRASRVEFHRGPGRRRSLRASGHQGHTDVEIGSGLGMFQGIRRGKFIPQLRKQHGRPQRADQAADAQRYDDAELVVPTDS